MTDNNLILERLRRIDRKMDDLRSEVIEVKTRLASLEKHVVLLHEGFADQSMLLNHIEDRLKERFMISSDFIDPHD